MAIEFPFEHVGRVSVRRAGAVVADLGIGAGRPFQAAADLAAQLAIEPPALAPAAVRLFDADAYGDAADHGVDDEAGGDRVVLDAFALAARFAAHIDGPVDVFPPRFGLAYDRSDRAFLHFLAGLLPAGRVAIVESDAAGGAFPDDTTALLVPGVVTPELRLDTTALEPLRGGAFLVPPALRRAPDAVPVFEYDWLAIYAAHDDTVAAWAQLRSNKLLVRTALLAAQAERLYANGHTDLALAFVRRLIDCSSGTERAVWLARLQGMRIGQLRFADAADEPLPAAELPAPLAGFLRQARGWGLVMTGRAAEADREFAAARGLLPANGSREHLYLLNISALGRARLGDVAEAEAFERRIEAQLAALEPRSPALEYINAINLHRLMRAGGRIPEARTYLERALATTRGTRSHNDAVYGAYNLWRVTEAEGRATEGRAAALIEALHCTLLFLADEVPEALASRTVAALAGEPWPMQRLVTIDEICERLRERFAAAAADAGLRAGRSTDAYVVRAAQADCELLRSAEAAGIDGLGVLVAHAPWTPRRAHGSAHDALRRVVSTALAQLLPGGLPSADAMPAIVLVDDREGRGLPRTIAELAEVAVAAEAARLRFGGRDDRCDVALDDDSRRALLAAALVTLGPGVARVEGGVVHFRRMLPPLQLGEEVVPLLAAIAGSEAPPLAGSLPVPLGVLQELERQHVLALTFAEKAS